MNLQQYRAPKPHVMHVEEVARSLAAYPTRGLQSLNPEHVLEERPIMFSMESGRLLDGDPGEDADGQCERFITSDSLFQQMLYEVRETAKLPIPILLTGESGVGKDNIARLIHEWSRRGAEPFIAVNAAALPRDLFESAFFGHAKGAFTGAGARHAGFVEAAGRGTVFIDEIGELETGQQSKLLRFLDSGEYIPLGCSKAEKSRARIITATNRDLTTLVKSGSFRSDLFYRLSVLSYRVPPLRERRCDITLLADYFIADACRRFGLGPLELGRSATELIRAYDWPGNVRELKNELLAAGVRKRRGTLGASDFSPQLFAGRSCRDRAHQQGLRAKVRALERGELLRALRICRGNCTKAAALLGIKRTTLLYKMKRLGLR